MQNNPSETGADVPLAGLSLSLRSMVAGTDDEKSVSYDIDAGQRESTSYPDQDFFFQEHIKKSQSESTSYSAQDYQMYKDFAKILKNRSTEETENGPSRFIVAATSFLEKYGRKGFEEAVKPYIAHLAYSPNVYLISEIMEMVGDVHSPASYTERLSFLENYLRCPIAEIRYGVVLGLSNIDAREAVPCLKHALAVEKNETIADTIRTVLSLLRT